MHEGRADRADAEHERDDRDEPSRPDPFTGYVGRDLEDDVGDVEDGENGIVVILLQPEFFLKTGKLGVPWEGVSYYSRNSERYREEKTYRYLHDQ